VRRIVLAADWSVSMEACLAGHPGSRAGHHARPAFRWGDVRGLLFAGCAWHAADFDAEALFLHGRSVAVWIWQSEGSTTRFGGCRSMAELPGPPVLVLTDGAGSLPTYIPVRAVQESALLIGLENYSDEQREDVRSIAEAIAGSCRSTITRRPGRVWATLIPAEMLL